MNKPRIYSIPVATVFPLYIAKAEAKGRTEQDIETVICWLTGHTPNSLIKAVDQDLTFEEFILQAPKLNPNRKKITGVICGMRVEEIEDTLTQEIRYIDKLVDEVARGKSMDKILRD